MADPSTGTPKRRWRRGWGRAGLLALALGAAALTQTGHPKAADAPAEAGAEAGLAALWAQYRRPDRIPYPADNPWSEAKARLGHVLFFDPRLSGSNSMSCASCHNPALGWEDGMPVGRGEAANRLGRATPTILNIAWAELLMWDGRKESLEEQALGPISADVEMNQALPELVAELSAIPGYRRLFQAAYGRDEITGEGIARALATFQRGVVSGTAPFDRWIAGDESAISDSAKRGFALFNGKANCAACHSGWRFTDDGFHDIGLASQDIGRAEHMPDIPVLRHAFKTPTLRNVAQRTPYMHDGSARSLRETVLHYDTGFVERPSLSPEMRRLGLSGQEVDDLVAFLRTLTSADAPVPMPTLPTEEE
jgi:cytochrome c peroxidase